MGSPEKLPKNMHIQLPTKKARLLAKFYIITVEGYKVEIYEHDPWIIFPIKAIKSIPIACVASSFNSSGSVLFPLITIFVLAQIYGT